MDAIAASTKAIVENCREKSVVHPGLEIAKFVAWTEGKVGKKGETLKADQGAAHGNVLNALRALEKRGIAGAWRKRRARWLDAAGDRVLRRIFVTRTPCVLWLAAPSPLELGFCLHHTYGVPYLPGSALKGLALRAAALECGCPLDELKDDALLVFGAGGDKGRAGAIDFLDGIPLRASCLERDVMTPHHMKYYSGSSAVPHDCEDPNPVNFLRIGVGSGFEIALLARTAGEKPLLDKAMGWLETGLAEFGLGAKTSSGYGVFAATPDPGNGAANGGGKVPTNGDAGTGAGTVTPPSLEKRTLRLRVVKREKTQLTFEIEGGGTCQFDAAQIERRFGVGRFGWDDRIRAGRRYIAVFKGERLDEFREEKK